MERDNDDWLPHLRSTGVIRDTALDDLRTILMHRLRRGLPTRFGRDDSFVDDACQEALLRIVTRLEAFEGRSRFLTWATSIAVRVALTELRRQRWDNVSTDDRRASLPEPTASESNIPETNAEREAVFECMRRVMAADLTEKQRTALELELNGMPQEEIARRLGTRRNALYKLTHDARKSLKRGMESAGYSADEIISLFA